MSSSTPTVSVSLVTYNHEKYIAAALRSVLDQTFADLEVIVVDDGSTDGTPGVVASFTDPRVVSIRQENQGPSAATNRAIAAARGRYLALMSGDDVCRPDRLARQLADYARGGPRLLFGAVAYIGEDGKPLPAGHFAERLFDFAPHTRPQALARFFHQGNFVNGVTVFTEAELMRGLGPYDPVLYQLQDFDLWVRALKRHEAEFLTYPTVDYRIRDGEGNLSTPTAGKATRSILEHYLVMRRFFDDCPPDLFRAAFADRLRHADCSSPGAIACEQAFLYLTSAQPLNRLIGVERLYELLRDPETATLLAGRYGFTPALFVDCLRTVDVLNLFPALDTVLYIDTGSGFTDAQACRAQTRLGEPEFRLEFDLWPFPAARALRWDPVKLRFCRLRLDEAILCEGGTARPLDLSAAETNGRRMADGRLEFETVVPMVFFPVDGSPDRLTLRGRLEVFDTDIALSRQYVEIRARQQEARAREYALQLREHELKVCEHRQEVFVDRLRVREHELEISGQQLLAHQQELHAHQRELQAHRDELFNLRRAYHTLHQHWQSIVNSRTYRVLQKARAAARFVTRRRAG